MPGIGTPVMIRRTLGSEPDPARFGDDVQGVDVPVVPVVEVRRPAAEHQHVLVRRVGADLQKGGGGLVRAGPRAGGEERHLGREALGCAPLDEREGRGPCAGRSVASARPRGSEGWGIRILTRGGGGVAAASWLRAAVAPVSGRAASTPRSWAPSSSPWASTRPSARTGSAGVPARKSCDLAFQLASCCPFPVQLRPAGSAV